MRLPIAFKIFGIAGFLAVLMIAAAVMSELRVREANRRVHALAGYLLPISDLAADFRAVTLEEEIHFRHVVAILTLRHTDNPLPAETLDRFRSYEERRATLVAATNAQIETALRDLQAVSDRLALTRLKAKFEEMVDQHGHVHEIVLRIIKRHQTGAHGVVHELIDVYETEQAEFDDTEIAIVKDIQKFVEDIAQAAQGDEESALYFNRMVTVVAVVLGLFLAGLFALALIRPLKRLRGATKAIESGLLDTDLPVTTRDEVGDLTESFNGMTRKLRLKERTEEIFGRYVDPRVVERLIGANDDDSETRFGAGQKCEATIFFSDIAGFTTISESLSPVGLVRLINEYLSFVSEPIVARNGLIDKFIGDAVMAFWCPPFSSAEDQARLACEAALAQFTQLEVLNQTIPDLIGVRAATPTIAVRIGLATGEAVVGSVGSERKKNFTAMGDTVNLGSRLEGANKTYGTRILICERTREMAGDSIVAREIDVLTVAGQHRPVRVFELVDPDIADADWQAGRDAYESGLARYRARDWDGAETAFRACLDKIPGDPPAQVFLGRLDDLRTVSPPDGWDGVWRMSKK